MDEREEDEDDNEDEDDDSDTDTESEMKVKTTIKNGLKKILSSRDLFKYWPRVIPSQLETVLQILDILVGTDLGP